MRRSTISLLAAALVCLAASSALGQKRPQQQAPTKTQTKAFLASHDVPFVDKLGYEPGEADGIDTIDDVLSLTKAEKKALDKRGFVISGNHELMHFTYGYQTVYKNDLPVYISADSILHAVHRSYDTMLLGLEQSTLIPELRALLEGMRAQLKAGGAKSFGQEAVDDADLYLTVALSLLDGKAAKPAAGADVETISQLMTKAKAHQGMKTLALFGRDRKVDFSQFKPRGHYNSTTTMRQYFRAMMWLGRMGLQLAESKHNGEFVFNRRQFDLAFALRGLMDKEALARWVRIDDAIENFVGIQDNMSVDELDVVLGALGGASTDELEEIEDAKIKKVLLEKGLGGQKIFSRVMTEGVGGEPRKTDRVFLLFGQRFVVDSQVFANVVYDRIPAKRLMPDPLDVAFAALGNDQAAALLKSQLDAYKYSPFLNKMRELTDARDADYWKGNLYNTWIGALRALSPSKAHARRWQKGLPKVMRTEAWGRRILNTQLASWAELRHDTILYAKQSYTASIGCEFPDAYVDPYPEFYAQLAAFGRAGHQLVNKLQFRRSYQKKTYDEYFTRVEKVGRLLEAIARRERAGKSLTKKQLAFVNDAVIIESKMQGCAMTQETMGWYPKLFLSESDTRKFAPTIADVHTQPTDAAGNSVGRILHVATGKPRLMVVTIETCDGPRAYVGPVSSYFEQITSGWKRKTDQQWEKEVRKATPEDVGWMKDLVVRP